MIDYFRRSTSGPYELLVVTAAFAAILLALFWRVVLLGEVLAPTDWVFLNDPVWRGVAPAGFTFPSNIVLSDVVTQSYPWLTFAQENLRQGVMPLWNPFVLGGVPFLANQQSAILYPLTALLYFLPMPVGIGYMAMIRLLITGVSSYCYLRTIGAGRAGSFVGSCAFTFGGFSIVWLGYSVSNAVTLFPVMLLFTERLLKYRGNLDVAVLALAIGSELLGGHPETAFHVGVTWAAYTLFRLIIELRNGVPPRLIARLGLAIGLACVLGIAVSAAQVLPFVVNLTQNATFVARQSGPGGDWLFFPGAWRDVATAITIAFPNALGTPLVPNAGLLDPFSNFNEQAAYVGTAPLVLAVIGALAWRRNSFVAFWLGAGVVAAGVAYRLPGFEAVNHLPVFSIAANGRLRMMLIFALAVLCAFGLDLLIQRIDDREFVRKLKWWLGLSTLVGLIGTLAAFAAILLFRDALLEYGKQYTIGSIYGNFPEPLGYYLGKLPVMYDTLVQLYNPLTLRMYLPVLFAAGFLLALVLLTGKRADGTLLKTSIVLLTVADLAILTYGYNPSVKVSQVYPETKVIEFLKERSGGARIVGLGRALIPNASMLWQLRDVRGYENTVSNQYQTFFDSFVTKTPFGAYNLVAKPSPKLFDLLGVKYIVAEQGVLDAQSGFPLAFAADGVEVYENPNALPRAFVVGNGRNVPDEKAMIQGIGSPTFKAREELLLESTAPTLESTTASGAAVVRDLDVNEVDVLATADAPAWLVLSDTYDEGWKAYVDGRETKVYRANYVMRAVRLEAGKHEVLFRYEPASFAIGLRISIVALLLTGAVAFYPPVRRRKASKATSGA
ncbi:MAG: YfhO family protein [Dehalococcoidales bacterium]|nr:YfhO family protein [Dehalococcoidales bacterium]